MTLCVNPKVALNNKNERLETTPLKARLNTKLQKNKKLTKDIDEIPCALDSKDTLFSIPPIMTADEPSVETSGFQNVPNMGGSGLDTASDLSLADIEHLLCDQEILNERETPYPSVVTPKDSEDLGWMTSLNDVLNFGTTDSKYNPLMGNQELDVLLGL
ncbi:hypothetical protein BDF14DRAFT_1879284 [Spinellus fusiger]|nr:hypothetical protein BDF14DRAFT_1879284 [Spinellus fusiger]